MYFLFGKTGYAHGVIKRHFALCHAFRQPKRSGFKRIGSIDHVIVVRFFQQGNRFLLGIVVGLTLGGFLFCHELRALGRVLRVRQAALDQAARLVVAGAFGQVAVFDQLFKRTFNRQALASTSKQLAVADVDVPLHAHVGTLERRQAAFAGNEGMRRNGFTGRASLWVRQAACGPLLCLDLRLAFLRQHKAAFNANRAQHGLALARRVGCQLGLEGLAAFGQGGVVSA